MHAAGNIYMCCLLPVPRHTRTELLQAAVDAGMRCVITYTDSSKTQAFEGAEMIVHNLNAASHPVSIEGLLQAQDLLDDREVATQ